MDLTTAPVMGTIGPFADGLDKPYWDGLREGVLRLQRCGGCDTWIWGPQWLCPQCHRPEPQWVEVESRGRIYSWTRTWKAFSPEFADLLPYITVVVELPHAGHRRLMGLLLGDDKTDPALDELVVGVIQPPSPLTSDQAVLRWQRVTEGN